MAGGERPSDPGEDSAAGAAPDAAAARPDEQSAVPRRSRRTPPTIDLKATELTEPAAPPEDASPQGDPAPETGTAAEPPPSSAAEPPPPESPPPESPGGFQPGSARDFLAGEAAAQDGGEKTGRARLRSGFSMATVAAGVVGGLLVALVLFVLWLTGLVPIRYAGSTAMRARVAVLEMQVQELANRPAAGARAREELAQRLDKVEQTLAQPPKPPAPDPALEQRLAAAENALKSVGVALAALGNRIDAGAARIDAAEKAAADAAAAAKAERAAHDSAAAAPDPALAARLETVAREASAAQAALGGAAAEGRRIKAALAALALRDGALSGRPFAAELAAAKTLGVDAAVLAALEPLAAAGIPGEAALAQKLVPLLSTLRSASAPAAPRGFLDQLEANASRLIRIRPVGEAATGSDPASVIARAEALAAKPDVAATAATLKALPADLRAPADGWITKVEARQAAREAAGRLSAAAARLLGTP